ncbi:MAG: hypothetical protein Q9220_003330 [cf. Caloplaca sp. 1 TL-2023]
MEGFALAAAVTSLLQGFTQVVKLINDLRSDNKDKEASHRAALDARRIIILLKERIEDPSSNPSWHKAVQKLQEPGGPFEVMRSAVQEAIALLTPSSSFKQRAERTIDWPNVRKRGEDIIRRIERAKTTIIAVAGITTYATAEAIREKISVLAHLEIDVAHNASTIEKLWQDHHGRLRRETISWFSPINFNQLHQDILQKYCEGTVDWLFQSTEFKQWASSKARTLWCKGIRM